MIVFRIAGRRTLMAMTSFDFILLLILSEATQNAMIGADYSVTNSFLVVLTLIGVDILFSHIKQRSPLFEKVAGRSPHGHCGAWSSAERIDEESEGKRG